MIICYKGKNFIGISFFFPLLLCPNLAGRALVRRASCTRTPPLPRTPAGRRSHPAIQDGGGCFACDGRRGGLRGRKRRIRRTGGRHIRRDGYTLHGLSFNPVLKPDAGIVFKVFKIFRYHNHVIDYSRATYQQIKIVISRSAGQAQPGFLGSIQVNGIAYRKDIYISFASSSALSSG